MITNCTEEPSNVAVMEKERGVCVKYFFLKKKYSTIAYLVQLLNSCSALYIRTLQTLVIVSVIYTRGI